MKITVSCARKLGMPEYSSLCASVELSIDADPADHAALVESIRRVQAIASEAVEAELCRQLGEIGRNPAPATEPASNGNGKPRGQWGNPSAPPARRPQVATTRTVNGRDRNDRPTKFVQGGPPRDGRQLFAWAKREQENGSEGLINWFADFGKANGYPAKITTWDSVQTADALAACMAPAN